MRRKRMKKTFIICTLIKERERKTESEKENGINFLAFFLTLLERKKNPFS
jgi:hypothetical protein